MKTIIKLVVALAVIAAAFNAGMAVFTDYRFQDAVHEGLLFNPRAERKEVVDMVQKAAAEYGVPIDESGITVSNTGPELRVDMSYTKNVVLIPGVYSIDWNFKPSTSTRFLPGVSR